MKNKKRIILASVACLLGVGAVVGGVTYAVFSNESKVNIAVTSGKVDVEAYVVNGQDGLTLTHKEWNSETGEYEEKAGLYNGEATLDSTNHSLSISKMLPMDKISFKIEIKNNSNVVIQYRTIIKAIEDTGLFDGLKVTIDDKVYNGRTIKSEYVKWESEGSKTIDVSLEMEENASVSYQDKSCKLSYSVEALQGNAKGDLNVNTTNIQDYLDGKYGSIDGRTLILEEGEYNLLDFGRATKYEGSNTEYRIGGYDSEAYTYDSFVEKMNGATFAGYAYYTRSISDVTFKAKEGANVKVKGVTSSTGHVYSSGYDYVLDKTVTSGANGYYISNILNNITFEGITFTAKVEFSSSLVQGEVNNLVFANCTFDVGGTSAGDTYQAIRYYNENANSKLKNLVVDTCTFNASYQSVYTTNIYGLKVSNSSFDTTAHNAIAIQDNGTSVDHGRVVITNNTFANIGDRIMRFGNVGADTQISIKNNVATDSGDADKQVIKASSLADGITYDISNNNWGEGRTVANTEFNDK